MAREKLIAKLDAEIDDHYRRIAAFRELRRQVSQMGNDVTREEYFAAVDVTREEYFAAVDGLDEEQILSNN